MDCLFCSLRRCVYRLHSSFGNIAFLKAVVIFFLLYRRQRSKLHLQLHGLCYILSFTEPQDQIITFFYASLFHSRLGIKPRQYIGPSFCIFLALIFLQNSNLFFQRSSFSAGKFILKNVAAVVLRGQFYEFFIIFIRFIKVSHFDRQFHQAV